LKDDNDKEKGKQDVGYLCRGANFPFNSGLLSVFLLRRASLTDTMKKIKSKEQKNMEKIRSGTSR